MNYFIKSEKGHNKLVDENNFIYYFAKNTADGKHSIWICEKRKFCKGRVWTAKDSPEVVKKINNHQHPAEATRPETIKIINQAKDRAKSTMENPQQILGIVTDNVHENITAMLPKKDDFKRTIRRIRNVVHHPQLPQNLQDLIIPEEYATLISNGVKEEFLLYDSQDSILPQRILIFSTKKNLDLMARSEHWYADGTFSTVPGLFCQLYTIHVKIFETVLPVVYALLPNKTKATYNKFLEELKILQPNLQPKQIMVDFEKASIQAFEDNFSNIEISGCFFHFRQNIWRKIQNEKLQSEYQKSHEFAQWMKMLAALAFVPPEDVTSKFDELVEEPGFPQLGSSIVDYFEDTYIGRRGRRERRPPFFPIKLWSMYERALNGEHRTNNHVEGWHRGFIATCGGLSLNIFKFIEALKKQQHIHNMEISQMNAGQNPKVTKRYKKISD